MMPIEVHKILLGNIKGPPGGRIPGPMNFEVRSDGHLYMVYDNGIGEPDVHINDQGHLIWMYENDEE